MSQTDQLHTHLKPFIAPPCLFVESAIARRLGLENWAVLFKKPCELHNLDYDLLNTSANGDLLSCQERARTPPESRGDEHSAVGVDRGRAR